MNELQVINDERFQIFSKENLGSVRTILVDNEVWFCIKDVCDILEIKNPSDIPKRLDEDEVHRFNLGSRSGVTNFTNESGLYTLILRSDKKEAKPFRKWITSEVIPTIRKTGSYTVNQKQPTEAQKKRLEIMDRNSKVREANMWYKLLSQAKTEKYKEVILSYSTRALNGGKEVIPLPLMAQRTLTATEIGDMIGVTGNKIGRLANKYNLKTDDYGYYVHDKSKYSNKEIPNFVYFEHTIEKFKRLLETEKK